LKNFGVEYIAGINANTKSTINIGIGGTTIGNEINGIIRNSFLKNGNEKPVKVDNII